MLPATVAAAVEFDQELARVGSHRRVEGDYVGVCVRPVHQVDSKPGEWRGIGCKVNVVLRGFVRCFEANPSDFVTCRHCGGRCRGCGSSGRGRRSRCAAPAGCPESGTRNGVSRRDGSLRCRGVVRAGYEQACEWYGRARWAAARR